MHGPARLLFALAAATLARALSSSQAPCTYTCPDTNAAGNELYIARTEPSTATLVCTYFTSDATGPLDRCEYAIVSTRPPTPRAYMMI